MTHKDRIELLKKLNWQMDETAGRHQICGERCFWIMGEIAGVGYSAWLGETSGMVYLHMKETTPKEYDFSFDEFVKTVRNGWPEKKVAPKSRGFDFGEDD